jgi:hypothetical protein
MGDMRAVLTHASAAVRAGAMLGYGDGYETDHAAGWTEGEKKVLWCEALRFER